jgi:hypothetical protein
MLAVRILGAELLGLAILAARRSLPQAADREAIRAVMKGEPTPRPLGLVPLVS